MWNPVTWESYSDANKKDSCKDTKIVKIKILILDLTIYILFSLYSLPFFLVVLLLAEFGIIFKEM